MPNDKVKQRFVEAGMPDVQIDPFGLMQFQLKNTNEVIRSSSRDNSLVDINLINKLLDELRGGKNRSRILQEFRDMGVDIPGTNPSRGEMENAVHYFVKNQLRDLQNNELATGLIRDYSPKRNVKSKLGEGANKREGGTVEELESLAKEQGVPDITVTSPRSEKEMELTTPKPIADNPEDYEKIKEDLEKLKNLLLSGETGAFKDHGFESEYDVPFGFKKYADPEKWGGKKLTEMTIAEVLEFQKHLVRESKKQAAVGYLRYDEDKHGNKYDKDEENYAIDKTTGERVGLGSSAVGAAQFISPTLRSMVDRGIVNLDDKFNKTNQDHMMWQLALDRYGQVANEQGDVDPIAFQESLSKEWASVANPHTDKSYYEGSSKQSVHGDTSKFQEKLIPLLDTLKLVYQDTTNIPSLHNYPGGTLPGVVIKSSRPGSEVGKGMVSEGNVVTRFFKNLKKGLGYQTGGNVEHASLGKLVGEAYRNLYGTNNTIDPAILALTEQFKEYTPDMQRGQDVDLLNINQFRVQPTRGFRFQDGGNPEPDGRITGWEALSIPDAALGEFSELIRTGKFKPSNIQRMLGLKGDQRFLSDSLGVEGFGGAGIDLAAGMLLPGGLLAKFGKGLKSLFKGGKKATKSTKAIKSMRSGKETFEEVYGADWSPQWIDIGGGYKMSDTVTDSWNHPAVIVKDSQGRSIPFYKRSGRGTVGIEVGTDDWARTPGSWVPWGGNTKFTQDYYPMDVKKGEGWMQKFPGRGGGSEDFANISRHLKKWEEGGGGKSIEAALKYLKNKGYSYNESGALVNEYLRRHNFSPERFMGYHNSDIPIEIINKYGGMAKHKKKYETGGDVNIDDSMAVSMLPFSNFPFPVAEQFGTIREQILNSGVQGMNRGGVALPDTINNTMGNLYNNLSKDILGSVQPDQGFVYDKQIASGKGSPWGHNATLAAYQTDPSITNFQDGGFTSALMVDDTDDIRDMLLNEYKAFKYEEGGAVNDEYAYIPIQFGDGGPVEIYGVEKAFLGKLVKGIGKGIGKIGKGIGKGLGKVGGVLSDVAGFASPFVGMIPGVGAALGPALGAIGGIGDYFQGGQGGIGKLFGNIAKGAGKGVLGNIGGGKGVLGGLLNKGGIGAMLKGGEGNFLGNILGGGQEGGLLGNITNMFSGGQGGGQGGGLADIIGGLLGGGNQQQESPLQYATPGFGGAMSAFNMGLSGGDSLMQNLMGALAPNLQFQLTRQGGFIYQDGGMVQQPQLVPIQTETVNGRSEMIIHLDGGITKVNATKPHKSMKKDEVTDIVPQGTFIASADKKMKMSYKDADKITMGIKAYPYKEGKQAKVPERISMAGLWGGSRRDMTPAELTEKVRRKYNIIDKDEYYDLAGDVFTERTNQENLASRAPYLAEIIKFNQEKKNGKGGGSVTAMDMGMEGLPSLPMFKHGGPVYMNDLDHAKFGKFLGKVGSFLGKKVLPAVGKAFAPKTSGASPFEIFGVGAGALADTAGTLQQIARMRGAYGTALDELATLGGQQRTGIDKMTAANLAGILGQDTRAEGLDLDPAIQRLEGVRDPTTSRAYIDALSTPSYDISALAGLGGRGAASAIAQMASDQMRQRNQTLAQTAAGQRDFNLKKASAVSGLLGQQALSDQKRLKEERLAGNQQLMAATGEEAQRQRMLMEQLGQEYGQRTGLTFGQAQLQSPLQAIGRGLFNAASMSRVMRSPLESLVQNYQPTQTPPTQTPLNYNPLGDWRSRMRTLGQFKIG